jgi:methionyl-tRNA formyltransferase
VHAARVAEAVARVEVAELLVQDDRLLVSSGGNTALELLEVQLEGRKRSTARDFIHGYRLQTGERLG